MKRSILFIVPGLTGYFSPRWERRLRLQERNPLVRDFFRWSKQSTHSKGMAEVLRRYFWIENRAPWAYFGIRGEGLQINSMDWFKITLLDRHKSGFYDAEVIRQLSADFANDFSFAENSIVSSDGNWYMSLGTHRNVKATSVPLFWNDRIAPNNFGLTGRHAPYWRERFREARHWLKEYAPIQNLRHPPTTIWPWGTRESMTILGRPNFTALFSDNAMFRGLGEYLGLSFFHQSYVLADLSQMIQNHPHLCIVDDSLYKALSHHSFSAWYEARELFVKTYLAPIMMAFEDNLIDEILVDDTLGNLYRYDKGVRLPFRRGSITYYYGAP